MVRLKKVETPEDEPETLPIRMTPRETIGIDFQYQSDFDQNGVLFYIGTNGNAESFENPSLNGRVKMTSSSIEKGQPSCITDFREPRECWTRGANLLF